MNNADWNIVKVLCPSGNVLETHPLKDWRVVLVAVLSESGNINYDLGWYDSSIKDWYLISLFGRTATASKAHKKVVAWTSLPMLPSREELLPESRYLNGECDGQHS